MCFRKDQAPEEDHRRPQDLRHLRHSGQVTILRRSPDPDTQALMLPNRLLLRTRPRRR